MRNILKVQETLTLITTQYTVMHKLNNAALCPTWCNNDDDDDKLNNNNIASPPV